MTLKLTDKYINSFINSDELNAIQAEITSAHTSLINKTGEGNDFLGWITLPDDYDKEEFARIKVAAEKIKNTCDVLIVIGIGGSYLGSRAVIEFLKSPDRKSVV